MEYKLPPLPDLLEKAITHFAQAVHYADTNGRIGAANNLRKEIEAYAIAAIEAQGVPDVGSLLNRLIDKVHRKGELWERCQGKGWPDAESDEFTKLRDETIPAIVAQLQRALASAPPAPQAEASVWAQAAGMDTQQEEKYVPCQHCGKNTASDNPSQWCPCPKQASVVQQEPVAWRYQDARGNYRYCGYKAGFDKEYPLLKPVALYAHQAQLEHQEPVGTFKRQTWLPGSPGVVVLHAEHERNMVDGEYIYTHPAQQAKPKPLSDEQITAAIYKQCPDFDEWHEGPSVDDIIAIVKTAHGIKGS